MSHIEDAIRKAKAELMAKQARAVEGALAPATIEPLPRGETSGGLVISPDRRIELNREQLRSVGFLPLEQEEYRLTKDYRAIKRALLSGPASQQAGTTTTRSRAIMVASALPGEGKTFTALNLALSLAAEPDWSVVLIDADAAKPRLTALLGLQNQAGLLDAIADPNLSLVDVMWSTDQKGLAVMGVGQASSNAAELLASARMRSLLNKARQLDQRTIFLFDSAPVLVTSEARALAEVVGQIVLVVKAEVTPRSAVLEAISILGEGRAIGLVLNQYVSSPLHTGQYGSKYGPLPSE